MSADNKLPPVTDLWSLIRELHDHPSYKELHGCASSAQRAQSCVADLSMAQSCCEALGQFDELDRLRVTKLALTTIQYSVVANGIVLYARATSTHSGSGERGSISIDGRLSEADLIDHRILIDLRNRVIAHVHPEEAVGDSVWHQERLILRADGVPGCVTRRVQVDAETITRLRRLVPIARDMVQQTFYKRINQLTALLIEMPLPVSLLEKHPFDAATFFGGVEAAKHALNPAPGGSAIGIAG